MPDIDERIVSMKFDNAQFEKGVSTSIKSLENLNKSLQFENVGASFDKITAAANNVNLSGAEKNVNSFFDNLSLKSIAQISLINNLITDVYSKGKKLINEIFVAPKSDGFKEYELKMGSVQTIIASTGAELSDINKYLEDLNVYADKTIYSFKDMTSSIGKFTNAGVELEDAVMAIKGISNEAAVSGANTQEASRAMYNFAQALSAGYVKLIDWKSIENANMATVEFKQLLIDSAIALGTVVKEGNMYRSTTTDLNGNVSELFNNTKMFNDSLSAQWMTTDVLVKTLALYADETTDIGKKSYAAAQEVKTFSQLMDTFKEALGSGWSQTFEIVIGDFNEAKELFTAISGLLDHITSIAFNVQNGLLRMWKDNGGREKLIKDIKTITENLTTLSDKVVKTVLGPKYAKFIDDQADSTEKLSKSVESYSQAEMEAARAIWYGENKYGNGEERVKNLEAAGLNAKKVQEYVEKLISSGWSFDEAVEQASQSLKDVVDESKNAEEEIGWNNWAKSFNYIVTTLKMVATGVGNLGSVVLNVAKNIIEPFIEEFNLAPIAWDIKEIAKRFMVLTGRAKDGTKQMDGLRHVISVAAKLINAIYDFLKPGIKFLYNSLFKIANFIGEIIGAIDKFLGNKNTYSKVIVIWELLAIIFNNIRNSIKGVIAVFSEYIKKSSNPTLKKILNFFSDTKEAVGKLLDSGLDTVVALLTTLANNGFGKFKIEGASRVIDTLDKIGEKIKNVAQLVYGNVKSFIKDSGPKTLFDNIVNNAKEKFGDNETGKKAFEWVSGVLANIVSAFKNFDFGKLMDMIKIGVLIYSVYITKKAFEKLNGTIGSFKTSVLKVIDGVAGVLTAYQNKLKADSLMMIAKSIGIISLSLIALSQVDSQKLYSSAFAIGIVVSSLALLIRAFGFFQKSKPNVEGDKIVKVLDNVRLNLADLGLGAYSTAATILALTVALAEVVSVILKLKDMSWKEIGPAFAWIGSILAMLVIISKQLANTRIDMSVPVSILAIAFALGKIIDGVERIKKIGALDTLKGIGLIALAMLSMTVAINNMSRFASGAAFLKAAAGMAIISVALNALIPLIATLTGLMSLNMEATVVALASIGALLMVVTLAAMGIASMNAEKSLIALGVGITALAVGLGIFGALGVPAIVGIGALTIALVALTAVALLLKVFGLQLTLVLIAKSLVIVSSAALIFSGAVFVCAVAVGLLAKFLPDLGDAIVTFANKLSGNVTALTNGIAAVIAAVMNAIVVNGPNILKAVITTMAVIFEGLKQAFKETWGPLAKLIYDLLGFLLTLIPEITNMLISGLIVLINSLANSILDTSGPFCAALWNLLDSLFALVIQFIKEGLRNISIVPDSWIDELDDQFDEMQDRIKDRNVDIQENLKELGENSMEAVGEGAKKGAKSFDPEQVMANFNWMQLRNKITNEMGVDIKDLIKTDPGTVDKMASEMGLDLGGGLKEGMTDADIDGMMRELGLEGLSEYTMPEEYESVADTNWSAYSEEVRDRYPQTKEEGAEMSKEGAEGAESTLPLYKDAAHNLVAGFANEIRAGRMRAYAVGKVLAAAVKNAIDDQLDIHSPSRETAKSGMYAVLGFVKGIEDYTSEAGTAATALGDQTVEIMKSPIERIMELLDGTLEYDPTIRPLLDTTQLETDINRANGLFGSTSYSLAGVNARINRASFDSDIKMGSPDVVQAINELRGDFNEMSTKLDNMQVVMDTGALVGSMAGPMDGALGRRQIYKGRGN